MKDDATFKRSLLEVGERVLIQSVCLRCEQKLLGSVVNALPEIEQVHSQNCKKRASSAHDKNGLDIAPGGTAKM
jgi:hypothetical protein